MKHKRSIKDKLSRIRKPELRGRLTDLKRPVHIPDSVKKHLPVGIPEPGPLESLSDLPKITNETVAEHREAVLKGARKYIYPLQHSRGVIIKVSIILLSMLIVGFFAYCGIALYKLQSSSTLIYEVTRVIPFPVAKAGPHFVPYENYLFELRHLKHYYETQQKENFDDPQWSEHLDRLKQDSMKTVINNAYVQELADKHHISVSNREVNDQIALVKSQNRLGSSDEMLSDVLDQFWGWSIDDFKRELKTQLLAQKVASELDTGTHARADNALAEINAGTDFAKVAAKYSDDASSKDKGGVYDGPIGKTDRDIPPQVVHAVFGLSNGQISPIINTGYTLEIVKNLGPAGEKMQAAHISFKLKPITDYIAPLQKQGKVHHFIKV
jgi:foldase protein PrsA